MTPRLRLLDNQTVVVSVSQLEYIRTCPVMWRNRHLYRRVPVVADAAKAGGHAFDAALNLRYTRCGSKPCDPATEAEMLALIDKAYEGVELPLEEYRTPARYKEVMQAYNRERQQEPFEVLGVQVPFAVELGSVRMPYTYEDTATTEIADRPVYRMIRVVLRGILDLFVRVAGHTAIIDTKTSKSDIDGSYENAAQMKAYMWAIRELARLNPDSGLPPKVDAALINGVIIRPPYKNPGRKPTGQDKPRNQFMRTPLEFYSAERLERWRRDALAWVEQALGWVARDHFPQNEKSCTFHVDAAFTNYGHYGKPCPYLAVCTSPESQQEMLLQSDLFMDYGEGPLGAPGKTTEETPI